jgi:hypothetical protein
LVVALIMGPDLWARLQAWSISFARKSLNFG